MNLKYTGILTAIAVSAVMAQEAASVAAAPAATPVASAPVAETAAPAEASTPAAVATDANASAAPVAETAAPAAVAPAAETAAAPANETAPAPVAVETATPTAEPVATPAAETVIADESASQANDVAVAPKAVRGESDESAAVAAAPAPKAVRGEGNETSSVKASNNATKTVYYETVYTREDGIPVRTVYVAQRAQKDTTTMDELLGLVPMKFKVGLAGSVGSYYLAGSDWDSDSYNGLSMRIGLMSIIPLTEYTMGVKIGAMFERSKPSETYTYYDGNNNDARVPVTFKFDQMKIDIPVLFTFKSSTSNLYFDMGAQVSIPVKDQMRVSYSSNGTRHSQKTDMIDADYRTSADWSAVFGFSIMANRFLSIDIRADVGLSDQYEGDCSLPKLDLSSSSFNLGITAYPF